MRRVGLMGMAGSIAAAIVLMAMGCGNVDGTEGTVGGDDSTQASELWRIRRKPPAPQPPSTSTGSGGGTGSGGSTLTTEQVIKAAQTADGAAIPQPSGPNHTCPEVVVRLGFWSCPTIGDTCASGGRSCTCSRTDGEGQFPSWICN